MSSAQIAPRTVRFWDKIAPRYARNPVADQATYERKLHETAQLMRPDMHVLEIGCGTGSTALHHASRVAHIHATDLSGKMLDIAQAKAWDACVNNITFEHLAAEDTRPRDGGYDMVMAHSVLHLVKDPKGLIHHMTSLLKPGGFLVTSTACLSDGMGWFRVFSGPGHALGVLPYISYLSQSDLMAAMRAANLDLHTNWRPGPRKAVFMIGQKPKS